MGNKAVEIPNIQNRLRDGATPGLRRWIIPLQVASAYLVLSTLTLPFMNAVWLGDLALFAVIQLPKIFFVAWLRMSAVMKAAAWPYSLVLGYIVPSTIFTALMWWRTRLVRPYGRWVLILLGLCLLDFLVTLAFANRPSLSIF